MPRVAIGRAALPFAVCLGAALLTSAPAADSRADAADGLRVVRTVISSSVEPRPARRASAATWCGTPTPVDLAPNALAGHPVHWIYAIPSDGADRFGTLAHQMQTDAEEVDAWWRREDPARTPRNDVAQLPCGTQLDLSSVRMPIPSGQGSDPESAFPNIGNALRGVGFNSDFTKYVVYYDGPVEDPDICGQGGGNPMGFGLAIVYVQGCQGVSTAAVAAHELLHTLDAVPDAAPHNCPAPNDGHTCDQESDIMNPFIDGGVPLSAKVLDPGRDDYYGHSGAFTDTQDARWLVQLDRQQQLTVSITGPGRVVANVPGLLCAQTCTTTWNSGTPVNLAATPASGSKLVRWSGACSGAGACNVTTSPGATVSALFGPLAFRLSVTITGRGSVRSATRGLICRPRCAATFPSFVPVRLTATPATGWRFRSWAGACRSTRRTCTVPMSAATSARAMFVRAG